MTAGSVLESVDLLTGPLFAVIHPVDPFDVKVRPAPRWLRRLWNRDTAAMTVGGSVFVDPSLLDSGGERLGWLLIHELVHVRQWQESGPIPFLWRYLNDYFDGRRRGLGHRDAYLGIAAELEARVVVTGLR